ncbi:hypothetical protein ACFVU3_20390 [Streptomyces sp. NPDC058052]|uniref:DUF6197 family protein n=1 Tax=Streptomyces sp. NPDC058052 TaxID=3346316 RepID=UPI0036EF3A28
MSLPAPPAGVLPLSAALLDPDALDHEAARLYESAVRERLLADAPVRFEPGPDGPGPAPEAPESAAEAWRGLLSVPVDRLVADALGALPPAPPAERPLPGRMGAALPDRLHAWRRIGRSDVRPSVHLAYARRVLTEWGWQNTPYRLRDARGARCVCGALLAAHRLGHGSASTMNEAGAWIMAELRSRGWHGLIGPWNRAPGRTAEDALALVDATIRRAALAGR